MDQLPQLHQRYDDKASFVINNSRCNLGNIVHGDEIVIGQYSSHNDCFYKISFGIVLPFILYYLH